MNTINEIEVSYRNGTSLTVCDKINSSSDAAEILYGNWDKGTIELHESFKIVLLDNSNRVKGIYEISKGGITGTMVDLRILFAVILKTLSVAIVLCHNHPSGKLKASKADRDITEKIKNAAQFFDIIVLDHIILAPDGSYYSFADNVLL